MPEKKIVDKALVEGEHYGSLFTSCQILVNKIVSCIELLDWNNAKGYTKKFKSKVIGKMVISNKSTIEMANAFDKLLSIFDRPFLRWGNSKLKKKIAMEQLREIIRLMGEYGIYIGQENIKFPDIEYAIDTILFDINTILPYAVKDADIRNEVATKLEFLKRDVVNKIDIPNRLLLKIIELINKVQTIIPAFPQSSSTKTDKDLQKAFEELRTVLDFAKLINKRPQLKEHVEKHMSSGGEITKETIEKIASLVFDKKIKEFEVDAE